ncbi:hypothetical protein BKA62DRAFT_731297 [Auriculariales sp. MPI-PUGE-AT-0066]|nr:hypothetical protein BKA62DRAFT_731297 [Auriculariales sp. MPI-PUGE-AT-0066]
MRHTLPLFALGPLTRQSLFYSEEETSITDERIEGFNDETGPYLFTLASPHLTVGGLIYFSLTLTAAPSHRLKSPKDETVVKPPTHERMLFRLDGGTQFRWPGDVYVGLRSGHRPMAIISIENSRALSSHQRKGIPVVAKIATSGNS